MMIDHDAFRRADLADEARTLRAFWRAVLIQGLREAAGFVIASDEKVKAQQSLVAYRCRQWIGSRDFREVCELAGLPLSKEQAFALIDGPKAHLLAPRVKARATKRRRK